MDFNQDIKIPSFLLSNWAFMDRQAYKLFVATLLKDSFLV